MLSLGLFVLALTFHTQLNFDNFSLALTKLDILDELDEIKIGASYMLDGKELVTPPANTTDLGRVKVNYITMPGWKQSISKCRKFAELPQEAKDYVSTIERLAEVPGKYPYFTLHFPQI